MLSAWADRLDLWISAESLGEIHRGRREHDIAECDEGSHVFKITRGHGFGLAPSARNVVSGMISDWFAVFPAIPSEYFQRLVLCHTPIDGYPPEE